MILTHTFFRFVIVGISNTLIGISIIYIAWRFLGWGDLASNLTGYAIGFAWSYLLNRQWTFRHRGSVGRSLGRFMLVCAGAYAVNLLVLFALRHSLGAESFLPHIAGMVVYTVVSYLGSRFFAFGKHVPLLEVEPDCPREGIPPP